MGRILSLVFGLLVVAFLAYQVMFHRGVLTQTEAGPKPALEEARKAAARIEADQNKRAEEALERASPKE